MAHDALPALPALPALLRQVDVLNLLKVSRATLHAWRRHPDPALRFPPAIRIGANSIAWTRSAVEDWLAQRSTA